MSSMRTEFIPTRYGDVPVEIGGHHTEELAFIRRSGARHPLEPGRVNYRANIMALRELGVDSVLSTCIVGSLNPDLAPGSLASLGQFLDFTKHRPRSLFDDHGFAFTDMTEPYCRSLRRCIQDAADEESMPLHADICYVGVDGPRYETSAEIRMFRLLGGDVVGHTGVTEAIMAREAGLCHASIVLVSNYGAGIHGLSVSNEEVSAVRHQFAGCLERIVTGAISFMNKASAKECECEHSPGVPQIPSWKSAVRQGARDHRNTES